MDARYKHIEIIRYNPSGKEQLTDPVVRELPVTIYFNEQELVTLLCTPEYLEDLAVGFLASEGLLRDPADLTGVKADYDEGKVWVTASKNPLIAEKLFLKRYITTGCGKGTSFYHMMDAQMTGKIESELQVPAGEVIELVHDLQGHSQLFRETGGVHSCALACGGKIIIFREDIGRHNATDKILGKCFREGIILEDKYFLTSGRVSSEILIKTAKMGIPVLVSHSAPTDLALQIAGELGVTVVGFARGKRFNIYTYPERISE